MKKKLLQIFLFCFISILLLSCSGKKNASAAVEAESVKSEQSKIDFDLSGMNYNMVSAITFEMLIEPEKYINKSVKMRGSFHTEIYEGKRYFSVIVWDATQCCPAGLDFIPPQELEFPKDFPQEGESITVTGKMLLDENEDLIYTASSMEV